MKYTVECQALVTYEIDTECEEDAKELAHEKLINNPEDIDWGIYAKEMKQCKECKNYFIHLNSDGVCYDCSPLPF